MLSNMESLGVTLGEIWLSLLNILELGIIRAVGSLNIAKEYKFLNAKKYKNKAGSFFLINP